MQLYIRRSNFYPPSRVSDYYAVVVSQVRAEAQSAAYKTLYTGDFLTSEERDILRWGRNATGTSPKRLSQGGMTKQIYREATAIECLVGFPFFFIFYTTNLLSNKKEPEAHHVFLSSSLSSGWISLPYRCITVA